MPPRTVGRIQTRAAFGELQRSRARASSGPVRVTFVPASEADSGVYPQVGYAIGKRCGNAVTRNTLRRRVRASVRAVAGTLPRGTYLIRVEPAVVQRDRAVLVSDVHHALRKAARSASVRP